MAALAADLGVIQTPARMSQAPPVATTVSRWPAWRRVVLGGVLAALALSALLAGSVLLYHRGRFRGCEEAISAAQRQRLTSDEAAASWGASALETLDASRVGDIRRSAERWHQKVDQIEAKGRTAQVTRVYLVGDMVYFVFFGQDDRIQDFACVGN
jgi:hypothetical protein